MPANTVKVDRSTKWGNPFKVGIDGDACECVRKFREKTVLNEAMTDRIRTELRGRTLLAGVLWMPRVMRMCC